MTDRPNTPTAAAILMAALWAGPAFAAEAPAPAPVHAAKTVGAMALETGARPTDGAMVHRQRGFAAPAAARWIAVPAPAAQASASAF